MNKENLLESIYLFNKDYCPDNMIKLADKVGVKAQNPGNRLFSSIVNEI
jgi:hypothetical protein